MINNCNFWTSEIFFDRLNFFLNDRNWSLYQLCLSADISVDTLYKLRKHHRLPTLRTVCTICDALEISLPEFFIMPFAAKEYSILLQKLKSLSDEFFKILSQIFPYTIISDKSKDFPFITDDK